MRRFSLSFLSVMILQNETVVNSNAEPTFYTKEKSTEKGKMKQCYVSISQN